MLNFKFALISIFFLFFAGCSSMEVTLNESIPVSINETINATVTNNEDYFLSIAQGKVEGTGFIHKFGHNPDIDVSTSPEDLWTVGGVYVFPNDDGSTQIEILSSNAADTEPIFIQGLDENFAEQEVEITLSGTTVVAIPGNWTRVFRAWNNGSNNLLGDVDIRDVSNSPIYAQIRSEEQQTSMAIYTIPECKIGYLEKYSATVNSNGGQNSMNIDLFLQIREFNKVFREREHRGMRNTGSSTFELDYTVPIVLPPRTDIKLQATTTTNNADIAGCFDIILVDIPGCIP